MYREIEPARRQPAQPILTPRAGPEFWWEENGVFNPGVTEYQGKILLLYRAYDKFHISRFGLAESEDGEHFERATMPVIDTDPDNPYERLGIEDARITKIDDTYYILHTSSSYHALNQPSETSGVMEHLPWRVRFGLQTTRNFRQFTSHGVLLPDTPAKNACLFPVKINGQFAVLYREHTHPDGQETETLKFALTADWRTWHDTRAIPWPAPQPWQQSKFGLGSPPLRTSSGWLMVYHAVDTNNVYRLGVMMLDGTDPTKISWFSNPILEPELLYEKEGFVPNVVYSCGAVQRGTDLWIYYGAADYAIGRAVLSLPDIL